MICEHVRSGVAAAVTRRFPPGNTVRILFACLTAAVVLLGWAGPASAQTELVNPNEIWHGLYTDATSYEPGESIQIYASAPDVSMVLRLVRLDAGWTEITRTQPMTITPQVARVGSFIEYPTVNLSGRISFTLEGWFHPTILGGDTVVVAGQMGEVEGAAGILVLPSGRLAGYVSDSAPIHEGKLVLAPAPGDFDAWLDRWHHLALRYDGDQVTLFINGSSVAQRPQSGPVATVAVPFRLGARAEAPGDLTGVIDGRLDSWVLWSTALTDDAIATRHQRGLTEADPAPDPAQVDLYVGFEDPYPSIADTSQHGHVGVVVNHGNPGVAGVTQDGRAFRLNHDQIVDAGWQVTASFQIPPGLESGMYAVQALLGPSFSPTQSGDRLSVRAFAIRPATNTAKAPIAVVLPTNTWTSYNRWPQNYGPGFVTERSRKPTGPLREGGNNSAYGKMGDGASLSYFHGWLRPSLEASPVMFNPNKGYYSVRAPNSMYLVQWLDAKGFQFDVYSDDDLDLGRIQAADYRVLMPHSHHEYWSDGMLDGLTRFLNDGGSVVAPAGNIFTWRTIYGTDRILETRKFTQVPALGLADLSSGIDGKFAGSLAAAAQCNEDPGTYYGAQRYKALGVMIHIVDPCANAPFCFGKWAARNTNHWLWRGSGLTEDQRFGVGRSAPSGPTYAVGHEADTWVTGMSLPGLAPGQQPVILAEGTDYDPGDPSRGVVPQGYPGRPPPFTCDEIIQNTVGQEVRDPTHSVFEIGGTILYFRHISGGHVLVIGASATPWALESEPLLAALMQRSLKCFALDQECGQGFQYSSYLPSISAPPSVQGRQPVQ